MDKRAMYVLSGDPITNGHLDIIQRAKEMFGSLRVALAVNPGKKYLYNLKEREDLTRKALQTPPYISTPNKIGWNVTVDSFPGLTVDYARMNDIDVIVRSARSASDFDFEKMLADIGRTQTDDIETMLLFARQDLTHISSSAVKELQRVHGDIHKYVPFVVKESLEKKISNQRLIGLTGEIGAGKSFVAKALLEQSTSRNPIHEIDMDRLGHEILETDNRPFFVKIRKELIKRFGHNIEVPANVDYKIKTKVLGSKIFLDPTLLDSFNELMKEPMLTLYREKLNGLEGTILVSSALFAEADIGYLTNYNIILVDAEWEVREKRLQTRGYSPEEIKRRIGSQMDCDAKKMSLERQIKFVGYGQLTLIDNTEKSKKQIVEELEAAVS
jgi:pantetheine-phosphate adenylyltransferase